ncbi:protection of telomeres protein 1, partial [Phenoliferia sp. Uapishka_3]
MADLEPPAKRQRLSSSPGSVKQLPLSDVVKNCPTPFQFRGKVLSVTPYNNQKGGYTSSISLKSISPDDDTVKQVVFRGKWASSLKFKTGEHVRFSGEACLFDEAAKDAKGWQGWKVVYDKGVKGAWVDKDDGEDERVFDEGNTVKKLAPTTNTRYSMSSPPSQEDLYANALPSAPTPSLEVNTSPSQSQSKTSQQSAEAPPPPPPVPPIKAQPTNLTATASTSNTSRKYSLIVFALDDAEPYETMKNGKPTGDWAVKIKFTDPTSMELNGHLGSNLFGKMRDFVPTVKRGSILLLQGINRGPQEIAHSNITGFKGFSFAVFSPDALLTGKVSPTPTARPPFAKYNKDEIAYACDLARYWRDHEVDMPEVRKAMDGSTFREEEKKSATEISRGLARGGGRGRPLLKIEDVSVAEYCDVVGSVVKFYEGNQNFYSDHNTIFITDYTTNTSLMDYQSDSHDSWSGPWGQRTLQITCWGPNAEAATKLGRIGNLLHFRNLRPKLNEHGLLEATLDVDRKFPEKVDVWLMKKGELTSVVEDLKKAMKKYEAENGDVPTFFRNKSPVKNEKVRAEPTIVSPPPPRAPSVVCALPRTTPDSLSAMLLDDTERAVYKLRGFVVDYRPARLEEWVIATCPECDRTIERSFIMCEEHKLIKLDYSFHLCIAETPSEINDDSPQATWVSVVPQDYPRPEVFPSLPATQSMREGANDISLLRERLAPILGQIEQKKRHKREIEVEDYGEDFDFAVMRMKDRDGKWMEYLEETAFLG